ncbi:hypothetical protein NliqN6_0686 [Naganishia liquefaciens]|uniref:C3H1-type domain-containing protein n=1 Tax=Naganishia liquefaciens TaxID=104408 RepID=A0A8H3TNV0_9TREE|nr:hypothetical protein NliqN6_0686 [Naganishia liquefaciens]
MPEAIDTAAMQSEKVPQEIRAEQIARELTTHPTHQKQPSTSAKASGTDVPESEKPTFEKLQPPLSSPSFISKSQDTEEEDYDPYPYGSAMSSSFVPPTAEAIAQAQAEQIALIQHHQSAQQPKLQGKGKDLSHVPCRFFKVGGCTAGLACPFSHSLAEPGHQKQVCQWFIKGNCRFGHKCALAHIKPGEEYTMDRKNKKAAQQAAQKEKAENSHNSDSLEDFPPAQASRLKSPGKGGKDKDRAASGSMAVPITGAKKQSMPSLGSRLGASYSDKLKNASMKGLPVDEQTGKKGQEDHAEKPKKKDGADLSVPVAVPKRKVSGVKDAFQAQSISPGSRHRAIMNAAMNSSALGTSPSPSPFGTSPRPAGSANILAAKLPGPETENFKSRSLSIPGPISVAAAFDPYGLPDPIGTPPREGFRGYANSGSTALAGSNPGTSPFAAVGSRATLSASINTGQRPAGESLARPPLTSLTQSSDGHLSVPGNRVISSSVVGAEFAPMGRDIWGHRTNSFGGSTMSPPVRNKPTLPDRRDSEVFALDDEDDEDNGEDFLPSSLSELLTPRERARRLSRHNSSQQAGSVGNAMGWNGTPPTTAGTPQTVEYGSSWDARINPDHFLNRQAQSAGAVAGGFLQSLWDDSGEDARKSKAAGGRLALGLNSGDRTIKSPDSAGSSNQTSGLSSMFASRGQKSSLGASPTQPATAPINDTGFTLGPSSASVAFLPSFGPRTSTLLDSGSRGNHSPSRPSPLHHYTQADGKQQVSNGGSRSAAVPTSTAAGRGDKVTSGFAAIGQPVVSPTVAALQSHAPGQSLPQGLAAGLSRIHLQPIQRVAASTASSTAMSKASSNTPALANLETEKSGKPTTGGNALGMSGWPASAKSQDAAQAHGSPVDEEDMFEMDG